MNYKKINLTHLIENISSYAVPQFENQRGFVWNTSDIEGLGESIIRGIPMSEIVTMPFSHGINIDYNHLELNPINEELAIHSYVVSGQQRITSIAKIFLPQDNDNIYHFDLMGILLSRVFSGGYYNPVHGSLCKSFNYKNDDPRFMLASDALSNNFLSNIDVFLNSLVERESATNEEVEKYYDILVNILNSVGNYSIAHTTISPNSNIYDVEIMFKKINSISYQVSG